MSTTFRTLVEHIEGAPPIRIGGQEYSAADLARLVSVKMPMWEAQIDTPQLITELGRLTAMAYRAKAEAEVAYRTWRDGLIFTVTNDIDAAVAAGFACACDPGTDSKGKPKEAKRPSTAQAEVYARQCPEYADHYRVLAETEEAWATVHTALEAARQRLWAIRGERVDDNMRTKMEPVAGSDIQGDKKGPPPPPSRRV